MRSKQSVRTITSQTFQVVGISDGKEYCHTKSHLSTVQELLVAQKLTSASSTHRNEVSPEFKRLLSMLHKLLGAHSCKMAQTAPNHDRNLSQLPVYLRRLRIVELQTYGPEERSSIRNPASTKHHRARRGNTYSVQPQRPPLSAHNPLVAHTAKDNNLVKIPSEWLY